MPRKNTWNNQKKKSRTALKLFTKHLKNHNSLIYASDMHEGFDHTYMTSTNGMDTDRCILWGGVKSDCVLLPDLIDTKKYDAQLNIEVQAFCSDGGCYVYIAMHKIGEKLSDIESWEWENGHG